jgi:Predicted transcriptional regulators
MFYCSKTVDSFWNGIKKIVKKDEEFVPFVVGDYIKNPVRAARIEADVTQEEIAARLGVTQGCVSKIEGRNYKVGDKLMKRVRIALAES